MKTLNKLIIPPHKTPRVVGALFVSVILNLFLVGVLVSVVPQASGHKGFGPMALTSSHGEYQVDRMVRSLNQDDAAAFHDVIQSHAPALKEARDNMHQAAKDVASAFEGGVQDQAALQAALDHLSESKAAVDAIFKQIVQEAYTKLSPDGRHRLADLVKPH